MSLKNLFGLGRSNGNEIREAPMTSYGTSKSANPSVLGGKIRNLGDSNSGLHFTVYNATGGKVIEVHSYDRSTDRTRSALYIITDKEDLGVELGLIITKESFTR